MIEVLVGTDDFSKYKYVRDICENENKSFVLFNLKNWADFEAFLPALYNKTLFSTDYCVYCDFQDGLSKKRMDIILNCSDLIEKSKDNYLFIGSEKSIKGLKKSSKPFILPKPWKDEEWKQHVKTLGSKMDLNLSNHQIERLVYETGPDMWKINNELIKLKVIAENALINENDFDALFYSYTKENLQSFIVEFSNRLNQKACKQLREILSEYNPIQIIYSLGTFYILMLKIKLGFTRSFYSFNDIREIATITKTNIPTISEIVGFSFQRNVTKPNLSAQYSLKEIEGIIDNILSMEIAYKNRESDFTSQILEFDERIRR